MGVIFKLSTIKATVIPDVSLSSMAFVASGVTSRSAMPVPPVVKIKSNFNKSHHFFNVLYGRKAKFRDTSLIEEYYEDTKFLTDIID